MLEEMQPKDKVAVALKGNDANAIKTETKSIKTQVVYRLLDGVWEDFENALLIDKLAFYKIFYRQLNSNGELLLEIEFDKDGSELTKTTNTYNDAGSVSLSSIYNEGMFIEKTEYTYDDKNRLIKESKEFDEGYPLSSTYLYDEENRVIEKRIEDSDGELQKRETFLYATNWKDKVVKHVIYDEENKVSVVEENEWEERKGQVKAKKFIVTDVFLDNYRRTEFFDPRTREDHIAMATFDGKEKVLEYVKTLFDEKDRELVEESVSLNDSDNFKVFYSYDELDRVILQEQKQADILMSKINRRFGEHGLADLIAVHSYSRGNYVDVFEYEFHS